MKQRPWFGEGKDPLINQGRSFVKMHGLRNDFIIVDGRVKPFRPSKPRIVQICDRRDGVGADQLLVIEPPPDSTKSSTDAFVRIYNIDGREVEACGNASRCVGWLLLEESGREEVRVETLGGRLACRRAGKKKIAVDMGRPRTHWQEIPLSREVDTLHLGIGSGPLQDPVGMNLGNPHAVFFVDDLDGVDLPRYGPEVQNHPLLPEQANVGVAQLLDSKTMKLSVWERPGFVTQACGTGACVAVAAAHRRRLTTEPRMTVTLPGGSMEIELKPDDTTVMIGPVEICFVGYLPR